MLYYVAINIFYLHISRRRKFFPEESALNEINEANYIVTSDTLPVLLSQETSLGPLPPPPPAPKTEEASSNVQ